MLEKEREIIDKIDNQIVKLFEERMNTVIEIAKIKKINDIKVLDSNREKEVIERVKSYLENKELSKYLEEFYLDLMNISKKYQKEVIDNQD